MIPPMRPAPPLALLVGLGAVAACGAGVALADGPCGAAACKSDAGVVTSVEPQPIAVGGTAVVKLMVKNNGPDGVANIQVRAPFPAGVQVLGAVASNGAGCATAGGEVVCELGAFAKEQGVDVSVTVRGTAAGSYPVPAHVTAAGGQDDNPGNDTHTATVSVNAAAATPSTGGSGGGSGASGSGSGSSGGSGSGSSTPSGPAGYLRVADPQRPLKTGGVLVRVSAYRSGTLRVRGVVRTAGGAVRLTSVTIQGVRKGQTRRVFLGTTKGALARIRSGLRGGTRLRTTITASLDRGGMKTEIHLRR
jgi:hypothetical protein